jgi:RND family efflux transporter MFP subunit
MSTVLRPTREGVRTSTGIPVAAGPLESPILPVHVKRRRSRPYIVAGLVIVAAVVAANTLWSTDTGNHLTAQVKKGPFDVVVVETGELQAEHSVSITAPVLASGGRSQLAIQYLAPEGTTVDSGATVVSFDPADQMKILSDKQNELKLAMADLEKVKVQQHADEQDAAIALENAKLTFELAKLSNDAMKFESESKQHESKLELRKSELSYKQAQENVKSKSAIRKSELGNLQLKIEQLQSTVDRTQADLQRLSVRSPGPGLIVYQRSWNTGKKLTKGDQVWGGQPIVQLPDLSHMQAALQVNEVDISKVKKDQHVEIALDAFPDKKFSGSVLSVASIGNPKDNNPGVKVFEVVVAVQGADSVLKPGMTVAARIIVNKIDNVLSVPIESVFDDDGKTVVYVENGSSFDKREVTLGAKNDNFVILTKGVKAGEKVSMVDPTKDKTPAGKDTKSSGTSATKPKV